MIIQTNKSLPPRAENDVYDTPYGLCKASLDLLKEEPIRVLDPGSGNGIWGKALTNRWPYVNIVGVEIRDGTFSPYYVRWLIQDFMGELPEMIPFDLVIGNPPYRFAEKFVRKSYNLLRDGGELLFLMRLAFLESKKRMYGLWKEMPPKSVHVLARRPSFTGNRKTNATAYALYLWEKGFIGKTALEWFDWEYE